MSVVRLLLGVLHIPVHDATDEWRDERHVCLCERCIFCYDVTHDSLFVVSNVMVFESIQELSIHFINQSCHSCDMNSPAHLCTCNGLLESEEQRHVAVNTVLRLEDAAE